MIECPKCRTANEDYKKFCDNCGALLYREDSQSQGDVGHNPTEQEAVSSTLPSQATETNADESSAGTPHSTFRIPHSDDPMHLRMMERMDLLDRQVANLQMDQVQARRPWFRDLPILISLFAFLFSFGTTVFSYMQAREQEIHNARVELRGLLQRLSALPKENIEVTHAYTDSFAIGQLSGLLQQENALLAKQAAEVMKAIPDRVTSSEYILVATAFNNSSLQDDSLAMINAAEKVVQDANDGVTVYRMQGGLLFTAGNVEGGRASYQKAVDIFNTYPSTTTFFKTTTQALTEVYWAQNELLRNQCDAARLHMERAKEQADQIPNKEVPNTIVQNIEQQMDQTEEYLGNCTSR
jgi:hypothetical protein